MPNREYAEDEIDLRDYIKVILNRKKVILSIFFIAVITTAIVSFLMPQVYESSSKVRIGRVDELLVEKEEADELLVEKEEAKVMLLSPSLLMSIIKELNLDIEAEQLKKSIRVENIKDTDLLEIKVQYPDADMAVKINESIVNSFISQGQAIYQERISLINERLKELDTEIKNTEEDIRKTQNLIAEFPRSGISSQELSLSLSLRIILLQNTLTNYESHLTSLRNQRSDMRILLAKSKDFKVIEKPIIPKHPIKPKKKQNVAISAIMSLMIGVLIVFFQEFWQRESTLNLEKKST